MSVIMAIVGELEISDWTNTALKLTNISLKYTNAYYCAEIGAFARHP